MKNRLIYLTLLGTALGLGGLTTASASLTTNSQPKISFKKVKQDYHFMDNKFTDVAYHAKSTKKNAYIWNDTHTKKLYNLKTYPTYTWYKTATGTYKGNHNWVQVSNLPDNKRGWVYKSNLTKGFNPKGYQVTHRRYKMPDFAGDIYHVPVTKKSVYLWNWSHTKKRANLKNYTNQNLYRRHSVVMIHNGKSPQWYYYVGVEVNKQTVYGYVRGDQVQKGKTPDHHNQNILYPDEFVATKDYLQYLKQSKYQKLARSIIKLFPSTPVDLGLSQIAAYNFATNDTWDEDAPEAISTKGYTHIVPFETVATYLMKHKTQTNKQKLAGVEKALNQAGYTKAKRAKLSNYRLGIYVLNNVMGGKGNEDGSYSKGNWYGLVIGKTE